MEEQEIRRRGRVLVVDDERPTRSGLEKLLRLEGFSTDVAGDAASALRIAAARRPDVVVTDIKMPAVDGVELLALLRSSLPGIPVIVMSAFSSALTRGMQAGANDGVIKPIDVDVLTDAIDRLIANESPALGEVGETVARQVISRKSRSGSSR